MKKLLTLLSVLLIAVSLFSLTAYATEAEAVEIPEISVENAEDLLGDVAEGIPAGGDDEKASFDTSRLSWSVPMALEGFGVTILAMCVVIIVVILTNKIINSLSKKKEDDQANSDN